MRNMTTAILICLTAATGVAKAGAQMSIEGNKLIVTTPNLIATFNGTDLIRVLNRTTNELHINTVSPQKPLMHVSMLRKTTGQLLNHGWKYGRSADGGLPMAAQTMLTDLSTHIQMNVVIDRDNQDVTVTLWAESREEEVSGLTWGIRGLDLSVGKMIIPALGGIAIDHKSAPKSLVLDYPRDWQAQMAVMESPHGGLVLYTHDTDTLFKRLTITRRGNYADLELETQATAPFRTNGSVKLLEWRLNAYKGDWMVPASGYRNVMKFLRKPAEPRQQQAWLKDIKFVETFRTRDLKPDLIDEVEKRSDSKQTLLYVSDWRRAPGDTEYPDYTPHPSARAFMKYARERGFRTMLRVNVIGMPTSSPDYSTLSPYHARDPVTGAPIEHLINPTAPDSPRLAVINPASAAYRRLLIQKLSPAMNELQPDALLLVGAGLAWNDGNGLMGNMNFPEGMLALERSLIANFPVALGTDQVNELIYPYVFLCTRPNNPSLPAHPICEFLFGDRVFFFNAPISAPKPAAAATAN